MKLSDMEKEYAPSENTQAFVNEMQGLFQEARSSQNTRQIIAMLGRLPSGMVDVNSISRHGLMMLMGVGDGIRPPVMTPPAEQVTKRNHQILCLLAGATSVSQEHWRGYVNIPVVCIE